MCVSLAAADPLSSAAVSFFASIVWQREGRKRMSRKSFVCRRRALFLAGSALPLLVFAIPAARAGQDAPLAIRGFDPIAYFTDHKPMMGSPDFQLEWDEHRYQFASAQHRDMFKAEPLRYAPQFTNFCAMALTRGELEEANPEYWLISDGKLYLFGKPVGPELFQRSLAENLAKARENAWITRR